jgi:hypothetical protein
MIESIEPGGLKACYQVQLRVCSTPHSTLVLAMVPDDDYRFQSWSKPNCFKISYPGSQWMWTSNSGTDRWYTPNPFALCFVYVCCPAGPSIDWSKDLILRCINSILLKSCFQQLIICVCMFRSLWYWSIWNLCFSFDILHFCIPRGSIVVLGARRSAWCLDEQICKT